MAENTGIGSKRVVSAASGATALTAVLIGLANTGVLDHMQRNAPGVTFTAFLFVVLAALAWLVHDTTPGERPERPGGDAGAKTRFRTAWWLLKVVWRWVRATEQLGGVLFSIGVLVGVFGIIYAHSAAHEPGVEAVYHADKSELTATVSEDGLTNNDRVLVKIEGLVLIPKGPRKDKYRRHELYQASVGPDSDGNVDHPIDIAIPPGRYDIVRVSAWDKDDAEPCNPEAKRTSQPIKPVGFATLGAGRVGCVIVPLPGIPARPRLSANWRRPTRGPRSLRVHVSVDNLSNRLLGLAVAMRLHGGYLRIAREVLAPNPEGRVNESFNVPVPRGASLVCIKAKLVAEGHQELPFVACPIPRFNLQVSAAELRVPGQHSLTIGSAAG